MEEHLQGEWKYIIWKTDCYTWWFLKQCKKNLNVPQNISQDTKYCIEKHSLKGGLYSQVVRIRRSIHKSKVAKEPLVEEEDNNNENETNTQK